VGLSGRHGEPGGDGGGVEEGDKGGAIHRSAPGGLTGSAAGEIEQWGRWGCGPAEKRRLRAAIGQKEGPELGVWIQTCMQAWTIQ
jgi:hypothetical protein